MMTREINEASGFRVPNDDDFSDFKYAKGAVGVRWSNEDIKHLHACLWGENDGPHWYWIIEFKDGSFGYLDAWCDYTGWGCQQGGDFKGGFKSAEEAINAIPVDYSFDEEKRAKLHAQTKGEMPYALS